MTVVNQTGRRRNTPHPYLSGNFAPIKTTLPLTPCTYTGTIPPELYGGEYVRNGGNPVINEDLGRDAHWFDGDGMLSGVLFRRTATGVQPEFVNQFVLTDVFLSSVSSPSSSLEIPILPSIATLVNPASTLYNIISSIFRTLILVFLSHLPGSAQAIKRISVANTGLLFHDGRALATCESGPPMRISLPGLETIGWYNGKGAEGEKVAEGGPGFGGEGLLSFMREWTTAHPRVDPKSGELIAFHSTFVPPYVRCSIVPATYPAPNPPTTPLEQPTRLLDAPVPGVTGAKMMHDFGVSFGHTVILDLPLSLDPLNLAKNKPVVSYDPNGRSRFGVFPRYHPERVRWFETDPCCIFHTANCWDETGLNKYSGENEVVAVNMLSCRLISASLVFSAGNIEIPASTSPSLSSSSLSEPEQCRLYYHCFSLLPSSSSHPNEITHEFALSAIPFEFPSIHEDSAMSSDAKYVYGCSTNSPNGSFSAALGRAVKIDCLVKIDAETLIARGKADANLARVKGCVDTRTVAEILASQSQASSTPNCPDDKPPDPISIFPLPPNHFAQEPRFISRSNPRSQDDGYLVFYTYDESQLALDGSCPPFSYSELWILDATDMKTVVAKVRLPQRVPYGLHGKWFGEGQVRGQREVARFRRLPRDVLQGREKKGGYQ